MTKLSVRVLLDVPGGEQMDQLLARARKAGFRLNEGGRLDALGVLLGSIDSASLAQLRAVQGIQSVETQKMVRASDD